MTSTEITTARDMEAGDQLVAVWSDGEWVTAGTTGEGYTGLLLEEAVYQVPSTVSYTVWHPEAGMITDEMPAATGVKIVKGDR